MNDTTKERSPIIVGNFEVAWATTDKRSVKMMGYVFADDTPEDINARIDMCQDAIDRQAVRADLQVKQAEVERILQGLELHAEHLGELTEKQRSGKKLVTQEKAVLDTSDANVRNAKRQIASLEAAIKAGRVKLNGAAAP